MKQKLLFINNYFALWNRMILVLKIIFGELRSYWSIMT